MQIGEIWPFLLPGVLLQLLMQIFLRHLSQEYAHPSFYATEAREAQRKKEQTCW
jgi:hypothetical protein